MSGAFELVLLRTGIAVLVAGIGAGMTVAHRKLSHRTLCALISLAAGALMAVALVDIIPEGAELVSVPAGAVAGWLYALAAAALGYLAFILLGKFASHICPACSATHVERLIRVTWLLIAATLIHSTMDGVAIAAGLATEHEEVALVIMVAVAYHKLPEGLALASAYRARGRSRTYAFAATVLIETSTMFGGLGSIMLIESVSGAWLGAILAFVGSGFLFVVLHALHGEFREHEKRSTVLAAAGGFVSMVVLGLLLGWLGVGE